MTEQNNGQKCSIKPTIEKKINRRDFLGLASLWACLAAGFMTLAGLLKFPKPSLLPEVSKTFKIGVPEDFSIGTDKILEEKKVRIIRDKKGIYAVSLICTHLGCIVSKTDYGYACPLHGSKFDQAGKVQ